MIKKFNIGKKVKIIDKNTNQVIIDDYIVNEKNYRLNSDGINVPLELISFDNKLYFFETEKYNIIDSFSTEIIHNPIPDTYIIELWRNSQFNHNCDIYREFDITELDPEVISLVTALNNISGLETVGSCSGHNKTELFIDINFHQFEPLKNLVNIINKYFGDKFVLTSAKQLTCNNNKDILLQLRSLEIGDSAYKAASNLSFVLSEIFGIIGE